MKWFSVVALLLVGCGDPCDVENAEEAAGLDEDSCGLYVSFNDACPALEEPDDEYAVAYVDKFCRATSDECLEEDDIRDVCEDIITLD
jgi:hypothetical protein